MVRPVRQRRAVQFQAARRNAAQRAEVAAAFYVCIYLGVALPVIGIGVLAQLTTLITGVATFAAVTGAAALALAAWHLRHRAVRSTQPV